MNNLCDICKRNRAKIEIKYTKIRICMKCFQKIIENRFRKALKRYSKLERKDYILIILLPDPESLALFHFILKLEENYPESKTEAIYIEISQKEHEKYIEIFKRTSERKGMKLHLYRIKKPIDLPDFREKVIVTAQNIKNKLNAAKIAVPMTIEDAILDFLYSAMKNQDEPWKTMKKVIKNKAYLKPFLCTPRKEIRTYLKVTAMERELNRDSAVKQVNDELAMKLDEMIEQMDKDKEGIVFTAMRTIRKILNINNKI